MGRRRLARALVAAGCVLGVGIVGLHVAQAVVGHRSFALFGPVAVGLAVGVAASVVKLAADPIERMVLAATLVVLLITPEWAEGEWRARHGLTASDVRDHVWVMVATAIIAILLAAPWRLREVMRAASRD